MRLYFDRVLQTFAILAAILLAAIAVVITTNVVLRNLEIPTLYGTLDAVEYALLFATFLGAPWVLSQHAHVQVDLLVNALPASLRFYIKRLVCLLGACVCAVFTWFGFLAVLGSIERGSMIRTAFTFPEWWLLLIVPASLILCVVEFLWQAIAPSVTEKPSLGM